MARKHGFFRPHVLGMSAISSTTLREGGGVWWDADALIDADFNGGRFRFNGQNYTDETAWLAAIGGSKSGIARTIGPFITGADIFPDGGIAATTGWTASNGAVSLESGALRHTSSVTSGARTAYKTFASLTSDQGYWATCNITGHGGLNGSSMTKRLYATAGGSSASAISASLGGRSMGFNAIGTNVQVGMRYDGTGDTTTYVDGDDFTLATANPYDGYLVTALSAELDFTVPATVPAAQVLAQWGISSELDRVRVDIGTDFHLHVKVARNNGTVSADLDLGVVVAETRHTIQFSATANRFVASLDGAAPVSDTSGTFPGTTFFWIGRSYTGETWTGDIHRVTVYAGEQLPHSTIMMDGDSYSSTTGSGGVSGQALLATSTGRTVFSTGVGGDTLATERARVVASPGLYHGVFIHWDGDGANGFTDLATAMADYAAMIAAIGHGRYLIVSPLRRANLSAGDNSDMADLQAALEAAYPSNYVDAQAILAANATSPGDDADVLAGVIPTSLLQGDGSHLTSTGMDYVTDEIAALISSNGW